MTVDASEFVLAEPLAQPRRLAGRALGAVWIFCRRKPLGAAGGLIIALLVVLAILGPLLAQHGPNESLKDADGRVVQYAEPGASHPLGTDQYGRDVLSRLLLGARTTLAVALVSMAIAAAGALLFGTLSAYAGGWVDIVIQRLMDALMAFPGLVLAMLVIALFGNTWLNLFVTIGVLFIGGFQRIVRSAVLSTKASTYVEAAQAIGASHPRILVRHILPNIMAVVIVVVSIGMGSIVLIEAGLSYLGLGAQAPTPSWGRDFADARTVVRTYWWLGLFPGLAISLVTIAFNLLGDALRDVLDPRQRHA
ncbi:MAG: ABC transporter permease [Dehalococcoidia bacterium]|nr:ABC transporter permease [Dehalococcoidia bacterium]